MNLSNDGVWWENWSQQGCLALGDWEDLPQSDGFCISAGAVEQELGKITGLAPGSVKRLQIHSRVISGLVNLILPGGGLISGNQKAEHQQEQNDLILPSADFPSPQEKNFHGALD